MVEIPSDGFRRVPFCAPLVALVLTRGRYRGGTRRGPPSRNESRCDVDREVEAVARRFPHAAFAAYVLLVEFAPDSSHREKSPPHITHRMTFNKARGREASGSCLWASLGTEERGGVYCDVGSRPRNFAAGAFASGGL